VLRSYDNWDYANFIRKFRTQECETFERIGLGELIDPNTGNYQKSILQLFDQLNQEDYSSAVFRAFVTLKLNALAGLRPEQWAMQWSPGAARHIQMLKDLGAPDLKSGDWMVRSKIAKYEAPLKKYFDSVRGVSVENQAKFLRRFCRCQWPPRAATDQRAGPGVLGMGHRLEVRHPAVSKDRWRGGSRQDCRTSSTHAPVCF
jgi:hypothetical protein